jgi:D-glycero-alpha-D-manno-heptose-7-phosphate kinase
MIISKTPFRISFFGGGSDYPPYYLKYGGKVLSTTINKYCYISVRTLPPFFDYNYRVVYSHNERVNKIDEIGHPSVRETLRYLNIKNGLEIHHDGDLPARAGLGTSSSFTVGLLKALYAYQGKMISKRELTKHSIHIEQKLLKENVGSQDQTAAAYGGLNKIEFNRDDINVHPITIDKNVLMKLQNNLLLYFTGTTRIASQIAKEQIQTINKKLDDLLTLKKMVEKGINILNEDIGSLDSFGSLLNDTWEIKRSLTTKITTTELDKIYNCAINAGALGGKVLGAGGGGFMLFYVNDNFRPQVKRALSHLLEVPFNFETNGSQIIYYNPDNVQV